MSAQVRIRSAVVGEVGRGSVAGAPPPWLPPPPSTPTASPTSTTSPSSIHHDTSPYTVYQQGAISLSAKPSKQAAATQPTSVDARGRCKCSQCDPNYYTIPIHMLFTGRIEYVCRDCQLSTLSYQDVQMHESTSGHRRWYNYPQ
ncbi:hypothetical protein GQ54DRAFT_296323 [Martensiomyces pterosporus]|nr:hypothetical protein GQ54DRAFT_296323 [Martensiomyces pterosporus]